MCGKVVCVTKLLCERLCVTKLCVCVWQSYCVKDCVWQSCVCVTKAEEEDERRRRRSGGGGADGIENQNQKPHTMMWGKILKISEEYHMQTMTYPSFVLQAAKLSWLTATEGSFGSASWVKAETFVSASTTLVRFQARWIALLLQAEVVQAHRALAAEELYIYMLYVLLQSLKATGKGCFCCQIEFWDSRSNCSCRKPGTVWHSQKFMVNNSWSFMCPMCPFFLQSRQCLGSPVWSLPTLSFDARNPRVPSVDVVFRVQSE